MHTTTNPSSKTVKNYYLIPSTIQWVGTTTTPLSQTTPATAPPRVKTSSTILKNKSSDVAPKIEKRKIKDILEDENLRTSVNVNEVCINSNKKLKIPSDFKIKSRINVPMQLPSASSTSTKISDLLICPSSTNMALKPNTVDAPPPPQSSQPPPPSASPSPSSTNLGRILKLSKVMGAPVVKQQICLDKVKIKDLILNNSNKVVVDAIKKAEVVMKEEKEPKATDKINAIIAKQSRRSSSSLVMNAQNHQPVV